MALRSLVSSCVDACLDNLKTWAHQTSSSALDMLSACACPLNSACICLHGICHLQMSFLILNRSEQIWTVYLSMMYCTLLYYISVLPTLGMAKIGLWASAIHWRYHWYIWKAAPGNNSTSKWRPAKTSCFWKRTILVAQACSSSAANMAGMLSQYSAWRVFQCVSPVHHALHHAMHHGIELHGAARDLWMRSSLRPFCTTLRCTSDRICSSWPVPILGRERHTGGIKIRTDFSRLWWVSCFGLLLKIT